MMLFTEIGKNGTSCHTFYFSKYSSGLDRCGKHLYFHIPQSRGYKKLFNMFTIHRKNAIQIVERTLTAGHVVTLSCHHGNLLFLDSDWRRISFFF